MGFDFGSRLWEKSRSAAAQQRMWLIQRGYLHAGFPWKGTCCPKTCSFLACLKAKVAFFGGLSEVVGSPLWWFRVEARCKNLFARSDVSCFSVGFSSTGQLLREMKRYKVSSIFGNLS